MKLFALALAALLCEATCQAADLAPLVSVDYAQAFGTAKRNDRLLAVAVGLEDWHWPRDYAGHILCRVPANHTYYPAKGLEFVIKGSDGQVVDRRRGYCLLIEQPGFKQLQGSGIAVVDPASGHVISVLPRRYCTPSGVDALMRLPRGTLTQRTLIWAVRTHPDRPQSAYGRPSPRLFEHAAANNAKQIKRHWPGHYLPITQFGAASEVSAVSWPESVHVVDAAVDLVKSWRRSSGHWRQVMRPHAEFGYDMHRGGGKWYGTGTFVD